MKWSCLEVELPEERMRKSKYSEAQIKGILYQAGSSVPVAGLCREHGMNTASHYTWRAKYGGMDTSLISRMKALNEEPFGW